MSKLTLTLVNKVTRPKSSPGVDWGGDVTILARRGKKELWKVPPSRYWDNGGENRDPGCIELVPDGEQYWSGRSYEHKELSDTSRVTREWFQEKAAVINEFFGVEVAHLLDARKTLLIEDSVSTST